MLGLHFANQDNHCCLAPSDADYRLSEYAGYLVIIGRGGSGGVLGDQLDRLVMVFRPFPWNVPPVAC